MTSNPSARQKLHRVNIILPVSRYAAQTLFLVILLSMTGCGHGSMDNKSYRNADEALADYASFLRKLSGKRTASTADLISIAKERRNIETSVSMALAQDTARAHSGASATFYNSLRDSVNEKVFRLVESRKRTFKDYLEFVVAVNDIRLDTLSEKYLESVQRFYESADTFPVFKSGDKATVRAYEQLLSDASRNGFRTKSDVFTFLRNEDRAFRSFLCHLSTLGSIPLANVRDNTFLLVGNIVGLADGDSPMLDADEVVILLTVRNNRRLLQNAMQCMDDIRQRKVKTGNQSSAYIWMLLQPWISFDAFSFSLMNEAQMKMLQKLADETPKCIAGLDRTKFPIDTDELPAILIKSMIAQ